MESDVPWRIYNTDWHNVIEEVIDESDSPVIVTDPPFNIGYGYDKYHDRMSEDDYYKDLAALTDYAPVVMIHYPEALHRMSIEIGKQPTRVFSWVYNSNTKRQHRDVAFWNITPDPELVKRPYYSMGDKRCREMLAKTGGARSYDWGYADQVKNCSKEKTEHPCQMPINVMRWVVGVLPKSATIIDPYMGSGTTGVACVMDEHQFAGIELSERYFNIAKERLENAQKGEPYMQGKLF